MANRSRALAALVVAALVTTGCSSRAKLHFVPEDVQRLDGLGPGEEVELETTDGTLVTIASGTTLRFAGPGVPTRKLRCQQIELDGSLLRCVTLAGVEERVDLSRTPDVYVLIEKGSSWKRIALGVLVVYVVIGVVACIAGGCDG